MNRISKWMLALAAAAVVALPARAEVSEVKIAQQFGIAYLPLMYLEHENLLEKHAKAAGVDVKVTWARFAGGNVMNDALLSGSLHFASGGVPPLLTLWNRTRENYDVRGVVAMNNMPLFLNTRNPAVKSIRDLSDKDKIALPAVKVSYQAVNLQMAAAKEFGEDQYNKLDRLTVSMSHPDGMAAFLSGSSEVNGHFTSPPFQYQELEHPGVRTLLNSYEILGGPHTFTLVYTTGKFRSENPKIYGAFVKAFEEAMQRIKSDKKQAIDNYIKWSKYKGERSLIQKILDDPKVEFTTTPHNVMKYAQFMHRIGSIKNNPSSWKDVFFPEIHHLPGS